MEAAGFPSELKEHIFSFLDIEDLESCRSVSSGFRRAIDKADKSIWRPLCLRRWGLSRRLSSECMKYVHSRRSWKRLLLLKRYAEYREITDEDCGRDLVVCWDGDMQSVVYVGNNLGGNRVVRAGFSFPSLYETPVSVGQFLSPLIPLVNMDTDYQPWLRMGQGQDGRQLVHPTATTNITAEANIGLTGRGRAALSSQQRNHGSSSLAGHSATRRRSNSGVGSNIASDREQPADQSKKRRTKRHGSRDSADVVQTNDRDRSSTMEESKEAQSGDGNSEEDSDSGDEAAAAEKKTDEAKQKRLVVVRCFASGRRSPTASVPSCSAATGKKDVDIQGSASKVPATESSAEAAHTRPLTSFEGGASSRSNIRRRFSSVDEPHFWDDLGRNIGLHSTGNPSLENQIPPISLEPGYELRALVTTCAYYEVILHGRKDRGCVAVGLANKKFPMIGRQPGWDQDSIGYHGDDGKLFNGTGYIGRPLGPRFASGDTVGCGVQYVNESHGTPFVFFTLNGRFLDAVPVRIVGDLYPTVGIDTRMEVKFNFGEKPFLFEPERASGKLNDSHVLRSFVRSGLLSVADERLPPTVIFGEGEDTSWAEDSDEDEYWEEDEETDEEFAGEDGRVSDEDESTEDEAWSPRPGDALDLGDPHIRMAQLMVRYLIDGEEQDTHRGEGQ